MRVSPSFEKYLKKIGKVDLLTPEEEVDLIKRIKEGDQVALDRLTKAKLRFVVSVAKQYQNQGLSLLDLVNEGKSGFVKAAQRFDETRGFKFTPYAGWWIRQSILKALSEESGIIDLPLNEAESLNKFDKAYSELEQAYEREPSADEIAELLYDNIEELKTSLGSAATTQVSIEEPFVDGVDNSLFDLFETCIKLGTDDSLANNESLTKQIDRILSILTDREKDVIKLSYGIGAKHQMSLEDIGEKFGLTRERISQLKNKAIKKLRSTKQN